MFKVKLGLFCSLIIALLIISGSANAVSWNALPLACLPERAEPWVLGKPESAQAACHCPPVESCPTSYEEYSDNDKAKMPTGFVMRCCPVIKAPEKCPNGKLKVDGVPCEAPKVTECPAKYYPDLLENGIAKSDTKKYTGKFKGSDSVIYSFSEMSGITARLGKLFNWSLRKVSFWDGNEGHRWINSDHYCKKYGSGVCASDGYRALGNNVTESKTLQGVIDELGAGKSAWFGITLAKISELPDNLANEDIVKAYSKARLSFVRVFNAERGDKYGSSQKNRKFEQPNIGLVTKHPEFVEVCRSVAGEYVTVEYHDREVNGETLSCPYLQCRYVYDSTMESCLEGSTRITLADGAKKKIADLKVGDLVMNDEGKPSKIKAVNKYQQELRVLYGINGGKATFTGDHPIKTKNGWKVVMEDAAKIMGNKDGFSDKPLAVGDVILGLDGKEIEVKSIERHANFDPINTYNLKIEGDNSFVAADMIVKGFNKMEMHY